MSGQRLAFAPDIGHRGHLPEQRLCHRTDRVEPLPNLALAVAQGAERAHVEAQPQRVWLHIAAIEQPADQRIGYPIVVAPRPRAIDHPPDIKILIGVGPARPVGDADPLGSCLHSAKAGCSRNQLAARGRLIDAIGHRRRHLVAMDLPTRPQVTNEAGPFLGSRSQGILYNERRGQNILRTYN